ncbi:hypothetical protein C3L33_15030, partial [Rhododendron williamsianum]
MEVGRKMSNYSLNNLKETELCLGLPGGGGGEADTLRVTGKRGFSETVDLNSTFSSQMSQLEQLVGWPPVRSSRKNVMSHQKTTTTTEVAEKTSGSGGAAFVKVSMDGAPYLRKVDLKMYKSYQQLSDALAKMFSSFTNGNYGTQGMIDFMNERKLMDLLNSSEYVPSYEDKDGDWMLVGDVPWEMFVDSCNRLRIMKGSEAIGLGK